MCRVRECGADLVEAQGILGSHGFSRFTGREGSNDRGDIDARAAETRLPESHIGVHRNSREDFHSDHSNTGNKTWCQDSCLSVSDGCKAGAMRGLLTAVVVKARNRLRRRSIFAWALLTPVLAGAVAGLHAERWDRSPRIRNRQAKCRCFGRA
jgi:hypothetical protein